jgi:2-polyprenyl-3-methyl-5-hydroxy-6-metoxy-1,4-benzoquinol methylase/predicted  nucleic acid-binding Zn-ribbon protein
MESYQNDVDLTADNSHTRCISLTGHGKRVLEFGCATGYISKILTEQFGCTVTGIELNGDAAAQAARHCHRVLVGDAETLDYTKELDGERFDVVLFQDVLEHLKDPGALLRQARGYIEPGGYVVASIPNIAHAAVALDLMSGRFAYRPWGLLDDTHLRFFSRASIYELFESRGYLIDELSRIDIAPRSTEFQTKLDSFPPAVVQFALTQEEATTYQFIVKAYPTLEPGVLAVLRTKLAAAQQADAERSDELTALRRDFEAAQGQLAAQDEHAAQLRSRLGAAEQADAERSDELTALRRDFEAAQGQLAAQDEHAAQLRSRLTAAREGAAARHAANVQLQEQLHSALEQVDQRGSELDRLSRDLQTATAELTVQQGATGRMREELESAQAALTAAQAEVAPLREALVLAEKRLAERETEVGALRDALRGTEIAAAAANKVRAAAVTARNDLGQARAELSDARQEIMALRQTLADEQELSFGRGAILAATQSSAQAVVNSASWKATRPLRLLQEALSCVREIGVVGTILSLLTLRSTRALRLTRGRTVINRCGLFDRKWYLTQHPDVANQQVEPITHYVLFGAAEGRDPSPLFDTSWYLARYPDVGRAGMNPLVHYVLRGAIEGRRPHPRFESSMEQGADPAIGAVKLQGPPPVLDARRLPVPSSSAASVSVDAGGPWLMCVSHVRPDAPRAGNEYRLQRMLRWAANGGYRVLLVHAPLSGDEPSEEVLRRLATVYPNLVVCTREGTIHYGFQQADTAEATLAGLSGRPVTTFVDDPVGDDRRAVDRRAVERTFAHDALIETVLALDEALKPKVVLVTYVFMTRFLPWLRSGALRVVDTIDVFSTRQTKVERYGVPDRLALTPAEEARYLARADVVVAIQAEEARELAVLAPDKRIVTAGVDFDLVPLLPAGERKITLLIASDNAMNVRGTADFLRFAWPLIRRQVPDAEFWMAGKICRVVTHDHSGVHAFGQIDDVDQLYQAARVVINPCVAGTGLKIKTVESLSRLRPVVCWPAGADGLPAELQEHCRVVENWYEFAAEVTRALQGDGPQRALWTARDHVAKLLSADTVYPELGDALRNHSARS